MPKFMPVILGGELRLPDNSRLRMYRKDRVQLPYKALIPLAKISNNGKALDIKNILNILNINYSCIFAHKIMYIFYISTCEYHTMQLLEQHFFA